jgi:hypothetical protein
MFEALKQAIRINDFSQLTKLLVSGIDVNVANVDGDTSLILATWSTNAKCMKLLLKYGANINASNENGNTPLMCAAWRGNAICMKLLLSNKYVDINIANIQGYTAIILAACRGNEPCMKFLLTHGAETQIEADIFNKLSPGAQNLLAIVKTIKDKITELLDIACVEQDINSDSRPIIERVVSSIVFSSKLDLKKLSLELSQNSLNSALERAATIYHHIVDYDESTKDFILKNAYLIDSSLGEDFKNWKVKEIGVKKISVNLAYLHGDKIENIASLVSASADRLQKFINFIPQDSSQNVVYHSVGEFALVVLSRNAMEALSTKIIEGREGKGGEDITKLIASYLEVNDILSLEPEANLVGETETYQDSSCS